MARPREFEVDDALERAMQVFWAKGFEATSLDDLCEATNLARSSLYAAFGSKHDIYLAALDRYEDAAVRRIVSVMASAGTVERGVAEFLRRIVDDIVSGKGRRGCFIGNFAADLVPGDREGMARARRSLMRIRATFREVFASAQSRGELAASEDIDALAGFITASIQGLRLTGKADPDRALLEGIATVMSRCLKAR